VSESISLPASSKSSSPRGSCSSPTSLSSPNSFRKKDRFSLANALKRVKVGGDKQDLYQDSFLMESDPDGLSQPAVTLETCSQAIGEEGGSVMEVSEDRPLAGVDVSDEELLAREDDNHIPGIVKITATTFRNHSEMESEDIRDADSGSKITVTGNEGDDVLGTDAGAEFEDAAGTMDYHIEETKTEVSISENDKFENSKTETESSSTSVAKIDELSNHSQELFSQETNLRVGVSVEVMEGEEPCDQPVGVTERVEVESRAVQYEETADTRKSSSPEALAEIEDDSENKLEEEISRSKIDKQTDKGNLGSCESIENDDAFAEGNEDLGERSFAKTEDVMETLRSMGERIKEDKTSFSVPELCQILQALSSLNATVCEKLRSQVQ